MGQVQVPVNLMKAFSIHFSLPFPQALNHIYSPQSFSVRLYIYIIFFFYHEYP